MFSTQWTTVRSLIYSIEMQPKTNMKRLHTVCHLIFKYLQNMTYLQCVNSRFDTNWAKETN